MQATVDQYGSNGVAKRVRTRMAASPNVQVMTTVVCADCGAQFEIGHRANCPDIGLARRQAVWLADKFVWDHIQDSKHPSTIDLPTEQELARK